MRFTRFGVTLARLEQKNIETIRCWRNSSWVRPNMRKRELIPPAAQTHWFRNLDPRYDWYFTAESNDQMFGLFHIKSIDWSTGCGEAGGFVGPAAALATLALMDFAFLVLGLTSLEAHYATRLRRICRFNSQLGYRVISEDADGFARAITTAERYFASARAFRKAATLSHGAAAVLSAPDARLAASLVNQSPDPLRRGDLKLELR